MESWCQFEEMVEQQSDLFLLLAMAFLPDFYKPLAVSFLLSYKFDHWPSKACYIRPKAWDLF